MPDYKLGKIYVIRSHSCDSVYVGATTQKLCKRFGEHVRNYRRYKNGKYRYTTSFDLIEKSDAYIELLEVYSCSSKEELNAREGEWVRKLDCVNKCIPGRTRQEYYEDNKAEIKQYYQDNKEQIIERNKQYRQDNKEKIQKQMKQYRQNNKERIAKYYKQPFDCHCGSVVVKGKKARHFRTAKHKEWLFNVHNIFNHL